MARCAVARLLVQLGLGPALGSDPWRVLMSLADLDCCEALPACISGWRLSLIGWRLQLQPSSCGAQFLGMDVLL